MQVIILAVQPFHFAPQLQVLAFQPIIFSLIVIQSLGPIVVGHIQLLILLLNNKRTTLSSLQEGSALRDCWLEVECFWQLETLEFATFEQLYDGACLTGRSLVQESLYRSDDRGGGYRGQVWWDPWSSWIYLFISWFTTREQQGDLFIVDIKLPATMEVVTDPETYETSEIVEKSSKTGVFSNKRLLVIKNGFLYYFTNVPKNYKSHVPNILTAVKELPKSSIQIKAISLIKMESSNSPNLIIKFNEKDMIEREDIRKSISDRNYRHMKKSTSEQEEWKFTYSEVLKCRLWYTALLKLKAHFSKQDDKIEQFFNNFDPAKRNSQLPPSLKEKVSGSEKSRSNTIASGDLVAKFIQEDRKTQQNKNQAPIPQRPISLNQSTPPRPMKLPSSSSPVLPATPQKKADVSFKKPSPEQKKERQDIFESAIRESKLQIIQQDDQIRNKKMEQELRQEIEEQIRSEQKVKAETIINQMKKELSMKADIINGLQATIKVLETEEKQKENKIRETEQLLRIKKIESEIRNDGWGAELRKVTEEANNKRSFISDEEPSRKSIQLQQFSVQTDEEDAGIDNLSLNKTKNRSFIQDFSSTQRDTLNWIRNKTGEFSFELDEKDRSYEHYDYYTQIGILHEPSLTFEQKIKRELKMINYISKMKAIAAETFKQYIFSEHPTKSTHYRATLFEIDVACSIGKIVNLNGKEKLVYSNKQHQKLKRQFKLYSYLQDKFINMSRKKKKFPLRVPLCFHVEYEGYSALLKYFPYLKDLPGGNVEFDKVQKYLGKMVEEEHLDKFQFSLIGNRSDTLYMVTALHPYKVTKDAQATFQPQMTSLYGSNFLRRLRMNNLSSNSSMLEEQIKKIQKGPRTSQNLRKISSISQVIFCRCLKNLYRSTQPFTPNSDQPGHFLMGFLSSPSEISQLISQKADIPINGLLINHMQYLFGLKVSPDFNVYSTEMEQLQAIFQPVIRSFSLNSLYPNKLYANLEKYIESDKNDLADAAFGVLQQVQQKNYQVEYLRAKYEVKRSPPHDFQTARKAISILENIKEQLDKHNGLQFQCNMLIIQCYSRLGMHSEALSMINESIEYVQYMFSTSMGEGEAQDYLYLLVAETLSKMGNHDASMKVYKKLLQNRDSTLSQQQICMSIASSFASNSNIEPESIIQFLLSLLKDPQNISRSRIGGTCSEWQAQMRQFVGNLYLKINNLDQSIRYLEDSLSYYEENGINSEQGLRSYVDICLSLFKAYRLPAERGRIFRNFKQTILTTSSKDSLSLQSRAINRKFVTFCFCSIVKQLGPKERKSLGRVLQEIHDATNTTPNIIETISLDDVEDTVNKLSQRQQLNNREMVVLEQVDIGQTQIFNTSSA